MGYSCVSRRLFECFMSGSCVDKGCCFFMFVLENWKK